jgi:hypothetical protein
MGLPNWSKAGTVFGPAEDCAAELEVDADEVDPACDIAASVATVKLTNFSASSGLVKNL